MNNFNRFVKTYDLLSLFERLSIISLTTYGGNFIWKICNDSNNKIFTKINNNAIIKKISKRSNFGSLLGFILGILAIKEYKGENTDYMFYKLDRENKIYYAK
tara:strand:+ start:120 stop:425 length:306 start_codon:yes stop_codon:yes gene_type:complete